MANHIKLFAILMVSFFQWPCKSAFLAPISRDRSKNKYALSVYLKTPPQATNLLLDLSSTLSWVDCTFTLNSIPCDSSICHSLSSQTCSYCLEPPSPVCVNDSCWMYSRNSLSQKPFLVQAMVDSLALHVTNGRTPGQLGVVPDFVLSCSERGSFKGLGKDLTGLAGLGRSNFSLPAQISKISNLPNVFALCLSSSPSAPGMGFFGSSGPYYFFPEIDLSKHLIYTPLLSYTKPSDEYFFGLTGIKVNGKDVPFDQNLLIIDVNGNGGTKLSTVEPYTVLHTSIYKALSMAFERESAGLNLTYRPAIKPFGLCYKADDLPITRVGPAVLTIDLVMKGEDVFWRLFGSNSMVRIRRGDVDAWCFGFVDGGIKTRTSIVIGAHQMVDNLVQFDLVAQRVGFTSSVLVHNTMCANFNFTTDSNLR